MGSELIAAVGVAVALLRRGGGTDVGKGHVLEGLAGTRTLDGGINKRWRHGVEVVGEG